MLVTSILSFSHSVFYFIKERNCHFSNISANAFNLVTFKNLSFGKVLVQPGKAGFLEILWEKEKMLYMEKMLVTSIFLFPTIFSILSGKNSAVSGISSLSSANAFILPGLNFVLL